MTNRASLPFIALSAMHVQRPSMIFIFKRLGFNTSCQPPKERLRHLHLDLSSGLSVAIPFLRSSRTIAILQRKWWQPGAQHCSLFPCSQSRLSFLDFVGAVVL